MNEFQKFINNYTTKDFDKIKFDWNGKYGDDFHDNNYKFRLNLCQYIIPQIDKVKIELIKDLYNEETKTSEATFSIYMNIHYFAQELLRRNWRKYLNDYMTGASYNMDSYLGTGRIEISKKIAKEILDYLYEKIKITTDKKEKNLLEGFLPRFTYLAKK